MSKKAISLDNLATFKEQYDLLLEGALSGKQATLVSGENIKTINNQSILGSGNIEIQGGGGTIDDHIDHQSANPVENRVIADALDGKEDNIQDLSDIRSGASLGATAYQKPVSGIPASDLARGVIPAPEIFWAEIEVTSYDDILAAYNAGKMIFAKDSDGRVYCMAADNSDSFVFTSVLGEDSLVDSWCVNDDDTWDHFPTNIPYRLAQLDDDTNHRTVSDQQVMGWNSKADVFVAEYDVTSYADIKDAYNAGKIIILKTDYTSYGLLSYIDGRATSLASICFYSISDDTLSIESYAVSSSDVWSHGSVEIPVWLSDLSQDSTHRTVTDTEKDTWNGYGTAISGINDKIPAQASDQNQLADKNFVNSSVSTATATFRGTFTSLQTLQATNGDKNDYAFYNHTDSAGNAIYDRYKYVGPPVDRLPDGYTEMLYLRKGLNVTAYIDTGIKIQSTDKIYIKCYGWQYEATEYVAFGASDSNGKYFRFNKQYLGGAAFVQTSTGSISAANLYNGSAIIECYDGKVYSSDIDGENKTLKGNLTLETVDNNFFLFAYNDGINNTISRYPQRVDLGDFIVYDQNGNKKLELIPCSNDLDAIGYYDTVSETFIAPTGDGLTAQALPTDRWLYEYSLNNSSFTSTQWASINSGITSSAVTKLSNLPTKPVDTAVQSLTAAEQLQARTNIGATAPEIFFATYGTTTYADALAAHDAGKVVVCMRDNGLVYVLYFCTSTDLKFSAWNANTCHMVTLSSSNAWTTSSFIAELTANRVTSWQSTPSDSKYPSEKLVKDSLDAKQPTIDANNKLDYSLIDNTPTIPTVPTISTDIQTDKSSTTKTAAPSAVYNEVHPATVSSQPVGGFVPNVPYILGTLTGTVTFALASPSDANVLNHYYWTFETGSTAPTITWPTGLTWIGGSAPTINASKHYEISVLNGIGVAMEV